jgi:hypothetical protein
MLERSELIWRRMCFGFTESPRTARFGSAPSAASIVTVHCAAKTLPGGDGSATVDSRGNASDQRPNFGVYSWATAEVAGLTAPVGTETASVPTVPSSRMWFSFALCGRAKQAERALEEEACLARFGTLRQPQVRK